MIQTDETDKTKPFEPSEMYDDHSSRPGFLQLWPTSNDTAQTQHSFSVRFHISAQGFTCGETTSYPYRLIGLWVLSNACYVYKSPRPTWLNSIWSLSKAMQHMHNPILPWSRIQIMSYSCFQSTLNALTASVTHLCTGMYWIDVCLFALLSFLLQVLILAFPAFNLFLEVFEVP